MIHYTEITDFEAPELDVYARLTEAQLLNRFEPAKGMFIGERAEVSMAALPPSRAQIFAATMSQVGFWSRE